MPQKHRPASLACPTKDGKLDPAGPQVCRIDDYATNLRALLKMMQATGAKLIRATTTPVPAGSDGRKAGEELRYNETASRVMGNLGIPTDNLHARCLPKLAEWQLPENVHFKTEGSAGLAGQVAAEIETALKKQSHPGNRITNPSWSITTKPDTLWQDTLRTPGEILTET